MRQRGCDTRDAAEKERGKDGVARTEAVDDARRQPSRDHATDRERAPCQTERDRAHVELALGEQHGGCLAADREEVPRAAEDGERSQESVLAYIVPTCGEVRPNRRASG